MNMLDSIRRQITPIHPEGYIFIIGFGVVALLLDWLWSPLGWLGLIATLWCAYFFCAATGVGARVCADAARECVHECI